MKDLSKIKAINIRSWEEGRYFDLWMIVHLLSGAIIGFALGLLKVPASLANIIALASLVFWEVAEYSFGVREAASNIGLDIILGFLAFTIAYYKFSDLGPKSKIAIFLILLLLTALLSLSGWSAYTTR